MILADIDHIAFAFWQGRGTWGVGLYLISEAESVERWTQLIYRNTFPTRKAALTIVRKVKRTGEIEDDRWAPAFSSKGGSADVHV